MSLFIIVCDAGWKSFLNAERWVSNMLPPHVNENILICQSIKDARNALVVWGYKSLAICSDSYGSLNTNTSA